MTGIEKFPHLVNILTLVWGTPIFHVRVNKLLFEEERYDRQGFPPDAYEDLMFLSELHDLAYPQFSDRLDPWEIHNLK